MTLLPPAGLKHWELNFSPKSSNLFLKTPSILFSPLPPIPSFALLKEAQAAKCAPNQLDCSHVIHPSNPVRELAGEVLSHHLRLIWQLKKLGQYWV